MSPEDRKNTILNSAIPLFAANGYKGTTTKQIAKAAGVSQALLFKYFQTKEDLYNALKNKIYSNVETAAESLPELKPSTTGLILIIYYILYEMLGASYDKEEYNKYNRLLTFSLLEDGSFAKAFYENKLEKWLPYIAKHIEGARRTGDLIKDNISAKNKIRFVHHLVVGFIHVNYQNIINYKLRHEELIEQMAIFSFRGVGLSEKAIQKHFNPELFFSTYFHQNKQSNIIRNICIMLLRG